jgi:hypothetical protein
MDGIRGFHTMPSNINIGTMEKEKCTEKKRVLALKSQELSSSIFFEEPRLVHSIWRNGRLASL